jgi:hypothetical protein
MGQLFRQPLQFGSSRLFGQRFDWGLIGGHAGISIFTAFSSAITMDWKDHVTSESGKQATTLRPSNIKSQC